jgi:penicillin-binding protein-related factor A (putative recombinase)
MLVLKGVEELKSLGETFEFDSAKKYLVLIREALPPKQMEMLRRVANNAGISAVFICAISDQRWQIFEMGHKE